MAKPPTLTDLNKRARKRRATVKDAQKGLIKKGGILQRTLNAYVINDLIQSLDKDKDNNLKNTNENLKKINKATKLKRLINTVINTAIYDFYITEFSKITQQTARYFAPFGPSPQAIERITGRGDTVTAGFLDELFDNNQISRSIQKTITKGITSNQNITDIKSVLTDQIKGKADKMGVIQSYHYQNGFNEIQAQARALDNEFGKALGLNYAIYQGGEKTTSREFCLNRLGGVYNREEILQWNHTPATWSGRMENNDILIDLGGWNCGHKLGWITYELAKRMNPAIEKSKYDE